MAKLNSSGDGRGTVIRVQHVSEASDGSMSDMERQMDDEAQTVLRDWDNNVQVERDTFRLRPRSATDRRPKRAAAHPLDDTLADRQLPDVDVCRRADVTSDGDDARPPLYTVCPRTGRRLFTVHFDVAGFDRQNVSVKVAGTRLVVHASQTERADGRKSTTQFCRKIKLPANVDVDKLSCLYYDGGKLVIEAPVLPPPGVGVGERVSATGDGEEDEAMMNVPVVHSGAAPGEARTLSLNVEVGRVFKATDVVVKLKGKDRLVVTAERQEDSGVCKLAASLSREFVLPAKIEPSTLKAGMTVEGVLKVTASLAEDEELTTVLVLTHDSASH